GATVEVTVAAPPPASNGFTSDDFNAISLDRDRWTLLRPTEDAFIRLTDNGSDAVLQLTLPAGDFDVWQGRNNPIAALQPIADSDFSVSAKFLSVPTEGYEIQGLLAWESARDYVRFDTFHDGNSLQIFAAATTDGNSGMLFRQAVLPGDASHLRLDRSGDTWTFLYSADGQSWNTLGSAFRDLSLSAVGPFAASTGYLADGFTAEVDYVFNTASPIENEDGGSHAEDLWSPLIQNLGLFHVGSGGLVRFVTDEPTQARVSYGKTADLELGTVGDSSVGYRHAIILEGIAPGETAHVRVTTEDQGGLTSSRQLVAPADPLIDVWYGDVQTFAAPGLAQRWVNILGSVSYGDVESLSYSLNDGPEQTLSVGPDTRRLQSLGDFNIDIDHTRLDGSAADDVVTIKAELKSGLEITRDVVIKYEDQTGVSENYAIDWAQVDRLQDVVQIVDGKWIFDDDGVRPEVQGYDRLLAIGDRSWDNYEVTLSARMLDLTTTDPGGRHGANLAFGLLWDGHSDNPVPGLQPKSGWIPGAAFFYGPNRFDLHRHRDFSIIDSTSYQLVEGETYNFRIRVEETTGFDRLYSLKVWQDGETEPEQWLLQGSEQFSQPMTGSLYLNAHYYGVSFGDIAIRSLDDEDDAMLSTTSGFDETANDLQPVSEDYLL
ncbi:MAG TPA: hypothetical protein VK943_06575, partial [Arenibaculum sp.]|nr:hypothetical protein [Arenibaculum sp.]